MFCWFSLFLKAASYFIRALEKLPTLIDKEQQKIADIQKDLPVLQEILSGTWNKEAELTQLKTDLAAIDRRILLSITPESGATEEGEAVEVTQEQHTTPENIGSSLRGKLGFVISSLYKLLLTLNW